MFEENPQGGPAIIEIEIAIEIGKLPEIDFDHDFDFDTELPQFENKNALPWPSAKLDTSKARHLETTGSGNRAEEMTMWLDTPKDARQDMQEKALEYLDYFEMELAVEGMRVTLAEDAPPALLDLVREVCGPGEDGLLVCLYEALTCIAEAETPEYCAIDEKVCPIDTFQIVVAALRGKR